MAKSAVGSVIAGGIAALSTYILYELALAGTLGAEAKVQALAVQKVLFPTPKIDGTATSDPGVPLPKSSGCPFIPGNRYVAKSATGYQLVWRGRLIHDGMTQTMAENAYAEYCQVDPY